MALQSEKISVSIELDTKQAEKVLKDLKKQIHSENEVDMEKVKERQKEQKKLNNDLLRTLVKFEALKTVFKEIQSAMQEGRRNLYEYSRLTNGAYSEILDKTSSSMQALGNALAVLEATFKMAITPLLSTILDKGVEFVNLLSRVVAELFDLPEYYQARGDIVKKWADNVRQTRMLISGLDRLNIFSGTHNTLSENMFYKVQNDGLHNGRNELWEWIKTNLSSAWNWIKTNFSSGWEWIKDKAADIWKWFTEDEYSEYIMRWADGTESTEYALEREAPWTTIKNFFENLWDSLEDWLSNTAWPAIQKWLLEVGGKIQNYLENTLFPAMLKGLNTLFFGDDETREELMGSIGYALSGLKPGNWFATVWEDRPAVGNIYDEDNPWNQVDQADQWGVGFVKNAEPAMSKFGYEIKRFIESMRLNFGRIFGNANGGVYNRPTLGLVAEYSGASYNPEIVTPQSILDDRLDNSNKNLLGGMASLCQQLISAINGINMNVQIGDDVIARSASRGQESYYKQMGRPLIR